MCLRQVRKPVKIATTAPQVYISGSRNMVRLLTALSTVAKRDEATQTKTDPQKLETSLRWVSLPVLGAKEKLLCSSERQHSNCKDN